MNSVALHSVDVMNGSHKLCSFSNKLAVLDEEHITFK